jgi:hypothetical protein
VFAFVEAKRYESFKKVGGPLLLMLLGRQQGSRVHSQHPPGAGSQVALFPPSACGC